MPALGRLAVLDHQGKLEDGHPWHLDVQDQECKFPGDEREEGLLGGLRAEQGPV